MTFSAPTTRKSLPGAATSAVRYEHWADWMRPASSIDDASSQAALGPDHLDVGVWRNTLGHLMNEMGLLDEARVQLEQAVAIGVAALGPNHAAICAFRSNLGNVLEGLGRLNEARVQYEQALTISEAALGRDHPITNTVQSNLERV